MSDTITVTIPAALRPQVEGKEAVAAQGETVGAVLDALKADHPALIEKMFPNGDGQMNRSINVYVNEEDIRFLDNLDTKVTERDQVDIILAIAGG
ncbi:MAG: MoaD/ThiS family protein [Phycisphaeraceae bacterium]